MKIVRCVHIFCLLLACPAFGAGAPPSDELPRELLAVMETRKLVDDTLNQLDITTRHNMQASLRGQDFSPEQERILENARREIVSIVNDEISWAVLEPYYLKLYRETFTSDEVLGAIQFYRSPIGQAIIKKMPALVKSSVAELQSRLGSLRPRLVKVQEAALEELRGKRTR